MQTQQKEQVKDKLAEYCNRYESQNKAANSLRGVSAATISQVLAGKWEQISDEMWHKIAKGIGATTRELVLVETKNYKTLVRLFKDAALHSNVHAAIDNPGSSKTRTAKEYVRNNKRAYRVECNEYWNKKMFLSELMATMGRDSNGLNVNEMVMDIVRTLKVQDCPLLILDEFDKVSDPVLYFFITLYNQLEGQCGIVIICTDYLKKRIARGIRLNKKGYKEFYSRIGGRFFELPGIKPTDIEMVCKANGVTKPGDIKTITEDSDYDMRRVDRLIHAIKNAA